MTLQLKSIALYSILLLTSFSSFSQQIYLTEAESVALDGFEVVAEDQASSQQYVRFVDSVDTATISFPFAGVAGNYDITVHYRDKPGGEAAFSISVNGQTGEWTSDESADKDLWRNFTIENVPLNTGTTIEVSASGDEIDAPAIDFISFGDPAPRSPYDAIDALSYTTDFGTWFGANETSVGYITSGEYIHFDDLAFERGPRSGYVRAGTSTEGGNIEFRLNDVDGPLFATATITNTGDWRNLDTFPIQLVADYSVEDTPALGTQDVYLVFRGGLGYLFDVQDFAFEPVDSVATSVTYQPGWPQPIVAFPNPSVDGRYTIGGLVGRTRALLVDATGRVVRTLLVGKDDLVDLSDQSPGLYLLRTAEGATLRLLRQ